jgi:formamidopyrimidine-DNA glycosylase
MPEGPEVKRSADFLSKLLVGKRLGSIHAIGGRYKSNPPEGMYKFLDFMQERRSIRDGHLLIEEVSCKGKFMYWSFRPGWTMWCTYGMSGQWSTKRDEKHCSIELEHRVNQSGILGGEGFVYFNDPRHFGTIKFLHDPDGIKTQKKLDSLGPDMLSDPPSPEQFAKCLGKKPKRTLAETLMDQSCVAGVGNYIKAESLYLSELSPHRRVSSLSGIEVERLRQQIINVMKASYNTGGATISTYRNVDGAEGKAQNRFVVYGNKTDPMGNPVIKEETKDGRTTHWCPSIQK